MLRTAANGDEKSDGAAQGSARRELPEARASVSLRGALAAAGPWGVVLLAVAAGCASAPPAAPVAAPAPASAEAPPGPELQIKLDDAEPYPPPGVPALRRRCAPKVSKGRRGDPDAYHGLVFDEVEIKPIAAGPRIRELPRPMLPRMPRAMVSTLRSYGGLDRCHAWARTREPLWQGTMPLRFEVDEFGRIEWAQPLAAGNDLAPLRACVAEMLTGLRFHEVTARRTIVLAQLDFRWSQRGAPPPNPQRPTPSPRAAPETCLQLPQDTRVDLLDLGTIPVHSLVSSRLFVENREPPSTIDRSFRWNLGAYQRCYAEAFARHPGLSGRLTIRVLYDIHGSMERATLYSSELSAPDPALGECVVAAAREQWAEMMGSDSPVLVEYPLRLVPSGAAPPTPPAVPTLGAVAAFAEDALARGWVETSLRAYGALAQRGGLDARRCRWRVGALRAALAVAPWVDARAMAVADDLVDHIAAHPGDPEAQACAADAAGPLARLFLEPFERAQDEEGIRTDQDHLDHYLRVARERHRALVRRAPSLAAVLRAPDGLTSPGDDKAPAGD